MQAENRLPQARQRSLATDWGISRSEPRGSILRALSDSDSAPTLPQSSTPVPEGERFGKFVRTQKLGAGGMGEVWKAWDTQLARWVALKFLKGGNEVEIARFVREAQTAGGLTHPHIAAVHEVVSDSSGHYIAMQYVDGRTLKGFRGGDPVAIARMVASASRAVAFAHKQGIIHRDLKPENVMVSSDGHVYVMDFGLARPVHAERSASTILGTPNYMSPEHASGAKVDARSDIYSLGATIYTLVTDRTPHQAEDVFELLRKVKEEAPTPPRVIAPGTHVDLETIILKCLEKDPARRYGSADALADDLEHFAKGEPIAARRVGLGYRIAKKLAAGRMFVVTMALLIVAGVAVTGWLISQRSLSDRAMREKSELIARDRARTHVESGRRMLDQMRVRRTDSKSTLTELRDLALRAEGEFGKAMAEVPDLPEALLGIGRAWRLAQDDERALKSVDRVIAIAPSFAPAYLDRVRLTMEEFEILRHDGLIASDAAGAPVRALRGRLESDLRQVETHAKDSDEARYGRALLAFCEGRFDRACELLTAYLAEAPADGEAHAWLGHALLHVRRQPEAEASLSRALACDAWNHEARMTQGYIREAIGDYTGAAAAFTRALEAKPASAAARAYRAKARLLLGDREGAIEDASEAIRLHPNGAMAYINRAAAREKLRDFQGAVEDAQRAIDLDAGCSRAFVNRGLARSGLGDDGGAVEDFSRALELEPGLTHALVARGHTRLRQADAATALLDYEAAIKIDPACGDAHMGRAIVRRAEGDTAGAVSDCDRAIELSASRSDAYILRGRLRLETGDPDAAIRDLNQAVKVNPREYQGYLFRGIALLGRKDAQGAYDDLTEALRLSAGQLMRDLAYYNRGNARAALDDANGAIEDYTKCIEIDPTYPDAYANRANLRERRGDREGAIADWKKALEVAPQAWPYRQKVEDRLRKLQ